MRNAHVSSDDWRAAAEFLGRAALAESFEEFARVVMQQTRELFGAEMAVLNICDRDQNIIGYRMDPDLSGQLAGLFEPFKQHWPEHPWGNNEIWRDILRKGRITVLSDFVSFRSFRDSGLWHDVYRHIYARRQIAFAGDINDTTIWALSANRLGSDYGPRERELAKFLQPTLSRIGLAVARRECATHVAGAMAGFFLRAETAYAVIDPEGRVIQLSRAARERFGCMPGGIGHDELPAGAGELRKVLRGAAGNATGSSRPFSIVRLPGGSSGALLRLPKGDALLLVQSDPPPAGTTPLTRRENEILGWLGEGKTNTEIGALLGISPRTIEKHCGNLFAKLGVETRLAAALAARIPATGG